MKQFRTTEEAVAEAFLVYGSSVLVKKRMPEIFRLLRAKGWSIANMASEIGGGDATPFLDCANDLEDDRALQEYAEDTEGDGNV